MPSFASSVAFHYGRALTRPQMDWFARFEVLVTHDPLPREQVAELRRRGAKLALYEWSVAHYAPRSKQVPVLNEKPLRGHAGAEDLDAFYYDPTDPAPRVRALTARLREAGYDGVFFDTTTAQSVHPAALAEYERRHPDVPYDAAFAGFLRALRAELQGGVIITNQGYRAAEHYLPYVDFDVTESLIVFERRFRRWVELEALMRQRILPAAKRYPHVRFVHLNYIDEANDTEIVSIVAIARMYGHDAFVALPDVTRTAIHPIYFAERWRAGAPVR